MNRIFTRTVIYDEESDEYVIELPNEICQELDLHPGDVMTYEEDNGCIVLRKRIET
jgi:uncharacterized membrane protein (UPF0127 family)